MAVMAVCVPMLKGGLNMMPEITGYRIKKDGHMFYVASLYDLMHLNKWHRCTPNYDTEQEAHYWLHDCLIADRKEHDRLKEMGRSFPNND